MVNPLTANPEHDQCAHAKKIRLLIYLIIIFVEAAVLLLPRFSPELSIGTVVMPGPLNIAHADYENNCSECHSPFKEEGQNNLCISCHVKVREDLYNSQGFHGRSPSVVGNSCKSCHAEHLGRETSLVRLDKSIFDHDFTDFCLVGAHARVSVSCDACHEKGKKFHDSPTDCYSCHLDDNKHDEQLGTHCENCHKETSWDDTYFSHDETCFLLEGKHRDAACDSCHPDKAYSNTSINCIACHLMNDIHDSESDEKCERCHGNESWQKVDFDHNTETDFVLKDRHTELTCDACHVDFKFSQKPGRECVDCHRQDDIHKGRYSLMCDDCHSLAEWDQVTFDHSIDTDYDLSGRHIEVQCVSCHKESSQEKRANVTCYSCHQADDVHKEQLGLECDSCHNTNGWDKQVVFDHGLTQFPLIGFHAAIFCSDCHLSSVFKGTDKACVSCHESDDFHKASLGVKCGSCHNPNGWRLWQFDHNLQTNFKIEGSHENLECRACHNVQKKEVKQSRTCFACHSSDDVHYRRFGIQCERCHTVESFKKIIKGG
jgi:hypothetical protein